MSAWRVEAALAFVSVSTLPGCTLGMCAFDGLHAESDIQPPEHVAILSVRASDGRDISIDLEGTLVNHSPEVDCPTAVYRFETEPQVDDIPAITFADPAPEVLSGGGFLLLETALPALRDGEEVPRTFADLPAVHRGDGAFERFIAISTCGQARIEVDVTVDTYVCAVGNREPPEIEVTAVLAPS